MIIDRLKNRGFTLIELLIVVVVIGLLALLVIWALKGSLLKGRDAQRKADLDRIKNAVEEYEKDHNCYPEFTKMQKCGTDTDIAIHPYLNNVPCDPNTGGAYYYEPDPDSPPNCPGWYRVYTVLKNTSDPSINANIGSLNYYVSSPNAPVLQSTPTSPPGSSAPPGSQNLGWGCFSGVCKSISGSPPNWQCTPAYLSSNCGGLCADQYGQPQNECQ